MLFSFLSFSLAIRYYENKNLLPVFNFFFYVEYDNAQLPRIFENKSDCYVYLFPAHY